MPVLQRVDPSEFGKNGHKSARSQVQEYYDSLLADYSVGAGAVVHLDEDDKRSVVKSRLQSAAKRRGFTLKFHRSNEDRLRFTVNDPDEDEDEDESETDWDDESETETETEDVHELSFA